MALVESFSGIRGVYDDGLDEQVALRYTYSYLSLLKKKNKRKIKIVIGTDTRHSKDIIKNAVLDALDCEVIDLGIASTPMAEYGVRNYKAQGGIIITASHNEPYWNGFKFLDSNGCVLNVKDMDKVIKKYNKIKNLSNEEFSQLFFKNKKLERNITKKNKEINKKYSDYALSFISKKDISKIKKSKLKVVLDPNGGTGVISKEILEKLGVKVKGVNMDYGIFNRAVEPTEDSLFYLSNLVRDGNYDFAAGFDCDADRVEIMAAKGLVSGNYLLALIADDILENKKNKKIVVNDATSLVVKEIAKKHKAKYYEVQVGEVNVVDKMHKVKAQVGGEGSSGGIIVPDSRCRDGVLTLIYILKVLANKGKKIEEVIRELPQFYNIKKKITINKKNNKQIQNKIIKYYSKKGLKIKYTENGSIKVFLSSKSYAWFRASKTEANVLRVIADSNDKKRAESIMEEAFGLISK